MSRERRFDVRPKLDCFYLPPQELQDHFERRKLERKADERGHSSVIRMLDSMKLSSYDYKLSNASRRLLSPRLTNGEYTRTNSGEREHLQVKNDFKKSWLSPKRSFDDTTDSLSDSAYSLSSDVSHESDGHSVNSTSTDSDNLFVYQQIMQEKTHVGFNTVTLQTPSGFSIDIDVDVTKTVVMLMKIILWLRQTRERSFTFTPRLSFCQTENNWFDNKSLIRSTKQPRSPKRISFSPLTLLISAVTDKSFKEAKSILESDQDVDVNTKSPSGQSLLHIAAGNADLKCVQLLLEHGADPNIKDSQDWAPLHAAIRRGKWKCAILLIEAGANFAEYSTRRIKEYNEVLQMSRTCYKSMEIFV